MKKTVSPLLVITTIALLIVSGCSKKKTEGKTEPVTNPSRELFSKIDSLVTSANTNAAMTLIEESIANPEFKQARGQLLSRLVWLLLENGRAEDAEQRYLKGIAEDKTPAGMPFGIIRNYYMSSGNQEKLIAWTEKLSQSNLPPGLKEQAFEWHMLALAQAGELEKVLDIIPKCIESFEEKSCRLIFSRALNAYLAKKEFDNANQFINKLESLAKDSSALMTICYVGRIDALSMQKQWPATLDVMMKNADDIPDNVFASCLRRVISRTRKDNNWQFEEELCNSMLTKFKPQTTTWQTSASQLISVASQQKPPIEFIRQLDKLFSQGLAVQTASRWYSNKFYAIMSTNDSNLHKLTLGLGPKLLESVTNDTEKGIIETLVIDGYFMVNNYDKALELLAKNVTGKDEQWRSMAISKITGHKALVEGRKRDAIKHFREFMAIIAKENERTPDPLSKMSYPPSMTLGHNAKRIGDILTSLKDEKAAAAAYNEARDYYKQAISDTKPDSKEQVLIKSRLAEVPGE